MSSLLFSCHLKDPFYDDYVREDLYRLPLIKPYELINLYGIKSEDEIAHAWQLQLLYNKFQGYLDHLMVTDFQVSNGIIFGHGKGEEHTSPNNYFVIIPSQKFEKIFEKKADWTSFLKQNKLQPENLYKVWPVFDKYKDSALLPWQNQIAQEP